MHSDDSGITQDRLFLPYDILTRLFLFDLEAWSGSDGVIGGKSCCLETMNRHRMYIFWLAWRSIFLTIMDIYLFTECPSSCASTL
jgi:hypothetical protein